MARAINKIAAASYTRISGLIDLPCKIINLDKAVIAINNGKVICID